MFKERVAVNDGITTSLVAQIMPLNASSRAKAPQFIVAPTEIKAIGIAAAANIVGGRPVPLSLVYGVVNAAEVLAFCVALGGLRAGMVNRTGP